jgi:hypothetical protein
MHAECRMGHVVALLALSPLMLIIVGLLLGLFGLARPR